MVPHPDTIVTFADLHRQNLLAWPRVSHRRVVRRHEVPSSPRAAQSDRLGALEAEVALLRQEVADLRGQLEEFRRQFE